MPVPDAVKHLLAPGRIGTLEIPNRIVMSPMGSNLAEADGHMGERIIRYYEERARGGVGLLIVGVGAISFPDGACNPNQVAISDDAFLPGLTELCERVHAHGAKVAIQLQHAGKVAVRDMVAGRPLMVPSLLPYKGGDLTNDLTPDEMERFTRDLRKPGAKMRFHEMSEADIVSITGKFAEAAERARRAGFDAVELHAGHGYLLSSFLSPASNQRQDAYGGSLENRARFLLETLRAVKQSAGEDFPLWFRLDSKEYRTEGGIVFEDALRTAELAESAGADAVHVSAYADPNSGVAFTDAPLVHEPQGFVDFAERIKRRVGIPVIAVGRIEPDEADALIAREGADFVAMARKLLADPELPNKLADGRPEDVRPCIYCYTCVGNIFLNESTCCVVNPATGREGDFAIEAAATAKRVLVIGGGPAGMEAARVAALRGHRVTLCERADRLGGTLRFSSLVYPENGRLVEWLEVQVRKLPIELRLGSEVTAAMVGRIAPDAVVVAVGAARTPSTLPGASRSHVFDGDDLRALLAGDGSDSAESKLAWSQRALVGAGRALGLSHRFDLTRSLSRVWMPLGRRVAIIGGGLVGVELAEFLLERGREVSVLETSGDFAAQMAPPRRWRVLHHLREHGVELLSGVAVRSIEAEALRYVDAEGGLRTLAADSVILAEGTGPNRELMRALEELAPEVHAIGDCDGVGYIPGAILDAAVLARRI
jgi:2,4-dienoyl-CoA reductase-like NADH-dependent reductase (Old Yellow Enzyme family)